MTPYEKIIGCLNRKIITAASGEVYLTRIKVAETPEGNVYLHHFASSDPDPDMHDHPCDFTTHILSGGYFEHLMAPCGRTERFWRPPGSIIQRKAEDVHRIELPENPTEPTITLVFMGKKRREWGFHTPKGWVLWREYMDSKFGHGQLTTAEFMPEMTQ